MQLSYLRVPVIVLASLLGGQGFVVSSPAWGQANQEVSPSQDTEPTIRFNFQQEEWSVVIPWFAEQAGFSLQPIGEWPSGTFYLKDDSEYTTMEALDQLNHALRMRDPAFTLIRNRHMLILAPLADADFPNELIETVTPAELDQRGKYETVICVFDLGDLIIGDMFEELAPMVSRSNENFFAQFPAANQIRVRETGGTLRIMRDLIERAKANTKKRLVTFVLKHIDAESFMLMARGQLGMAAGQDATRDGSISITREPFGRRLFVTATEAMHQRFDEVAAAIDVPEDQDASVQVKPQRFKQYAILVDPELGKGMIEFVLEGRPGAKMEQDKINNSVMVYGTDDDHLLVEQALQAIAEVSGVAFEIIPLQYADAKTVLPAVQNLLGQATGLGSPEPKADAPILLADTEKNQIIARGKPKDIEDIRRMVQSLDDTAKTESSGIRTDTRVIDLEPRDAERLPEILGYLLEGEGRKNPIRMVLPEQRKDFRSRNFRGSFRGLNDTQDSDDVPPSTTRQNDSDRLNQSRSSSSSTSLSPSTSSQWKKSAQVTGFLASQLLGVSPISANQLMLRQDQDQEPDDSTDRRNAAEGYKPPDSIPSEPGAEIIARFTDSGKLILTSRDLDALDDLEYAIARELGEKSSLEAATVFPITHRGVNEVKSTLEELFGMASSGGGDGANPLGNLARNMVPGMGGLLDGLLSPSGGSSGGSAELEGDVKFSVDVPLNYLFVSGATTNDLDMITEYLEMLDQPNPAHNMDLVGRTYAIKVDHRDPEFVKQRVEELVPKYIDKASAEGGQPQQNNEAMQMMRQLAQLTGGRGGNNAGGQEQKESKARLSVDTDRGYLLVTGPDHIYVKIKEIVDTIDIPNNEKPKQHSFLDRPQVDTATLKSMLEDRFPGIEFKQAGAEEASSANSNQQRSGNQNNQNQRGETAPNQDEMRARAMEMMNRMQGGGRDQQGGGRGGRQGGGGGRGTGGGGGPQRGGGIF